MRVKLIHVGPFRGCGTVATGASLAPVAQGKSKHSCETLFEWATQ